MKRCVFWSLTFILCMYAAWSELRTGVHDFPEDRCGDCHAYAPVKNDARARVMKAPVSELCDRCHRRPENSLSHPAEITPVGVTLPADLPLSWDGKMTCSTCHDIHASPPPAWEGPWHFLRRNGGRAFCEACHRRGVVEAVDPAGHSQALASAHMEFDGKKTGGVDKISLYCIGCHDGNTAPGVEVRLLSSRHGVSPDGLGNELSHPVGVNYRRAMARRGGLHPPEKLDRRIRLVNGSVSCVSCHDMYSRKRKLLTVAMDKSGLCLQCHDK